MDSGRAAALVALGAVYGALLGALAYRRWLELNARVDRLSDRVYRLEFPAPANGSPQAPAAAAVAKRAKVPATAPAEG